MAIYEPALHHHHAMTQGMAQIERARGFLEAAQLSESWVQQATSEKYTCDMVRKLKSPIDLSTKTLNYE